MDAMKTMTKVYDLIDGLDDDDKLWILESLSSLVKARIASFPACKDNADKE